MTSVSLTEAKASLSELVARAAEGETIQITRHGKPIAQLTSVNAPKTPIDIGALHALTNAMTPQTMSADKFVRQMRDRDRY